MADINKNNLGKNQWWQPALEIFAQITGWIAGPIIIALFLGKYLDTKYNSRPWIFLGLTALAFLITCFAIARLTTDYIKKIEKGAKDKKNNDTNKR